MRKENRTIYTVLGMLSIEPMTGYDIRTAIAESTAFFWSESDGQLYPTLSCCVDDGYATVTELETPGQQRTKKLYTITKQGKVLLQEWLKTSVSHTIARNELLLKLFFTKRGMKFQKQILETIQRL